MRKFRALRGFAEARRAGIEVFSAYVETRLQAITRVDTFEHNMVRTEEGGLGSTNQVPRESTKAISEINSHATFDLILFHVDSGSSMWLLSHASPVDIGVRQSSTFGTCRSVCWLKCG